MITREQALEKADAVINGGRPAEERKELGIYEFEHGYVVSIIEPVDERGIPRTVGNVNTIVDKQTGELSRGSSLSPDTDAERYSAKRRSGQ